MKKIRISVNLPTRPTENTHSRRERLRFERENNIRNRIHGKTRQYKRTAKHRGEPQDDH